jgi:hypothetical protein
LRNVALDAVKPSLAEEIAVGSNLAAVDLSIAADVGRQRGVPFAERHPRVNVLLWLGGSVAAADRREQQR